MADEPTSGPDPRRVRRGEGEVTQWPKGVVGYVPVGPVDPGSSSEGDRLENRIELAARLIALLRAPDRGMEAEIRQLEGAREAVAAGDRGAAGERVERLLAQLGREADGAASGGPPRT